MKQDVVFKYKQFSTRRLEMVLCAIPCSLPCTFSLLFPSFRIKKFR